MVMSSLLQLFYHSLFRLEMGPLNTVVTLTRIASWRNIEAVDSLVLNNVAADSLKGVEAVVSSWKGIEAVSSLISALEGVEAMPAVVMGAVKGDVGAGGLRGDVVGTESVAAQVRGVGDLANPR